MLHYDFNINGRIYRCYKAYYSEMNELIEQNVEDAKKSALCVYVGVYCKRERYINQLGLPAMSSMVDPCGMYMDKIDNWSMMETLSHTDEGFKYLYTVDTNDFGNNIVLVFTVEGNDGLSDADLNYLAYIFYQRVCVGRTYNLANVVNTEFNIPEDLESVDTAGLDTFLEAAVKKLDENNVFAVK